ncbi:SRPBCC family protein [Bradyrhizobium guangxiense]
MTTIQLSPRQMLTRAATLGLVLLGTTPAFAATISRSLEVKAPVSDVWSVIGPFCAIKNWLPPVGQCIEDGKAPPTRILVTKDGKAAFVEAQTARNDAEHSYSYKFLASPLPVSNYTATIKVTAKADGSSVITWSGSYRPDEGQEKAADEALNGVYEAGLAEIRTKFSK